jgi:hypothetical protein
MVLIMVLVYPTSTSNSSSSSFFSIRQLFAGAPSLVSTLAFKLIDYKYYFFSWNSALCLSYTSTSKLPGSSQSSHFHVLTNFNRPTKLTLNKIAENFEEKLQLHIGKDDIILEEEENVRWFQRLKPRRLKDSMKGWALRQLFASLFGSHNWLAIS